MREDSFGGADAAESFRAAVPRKCAEGYKGRVASFASLWPSGDATTETGRVFDGDRC